MTKVTVIIPTYNRAQYISEAIGSILNQTYQDFEIIIVDDGSTDNTKAIVNKLQEKDQRIVYVYQENSGVSAARNAGMNISKGKYIAFLDSDDLALPNRLEDQVSILDKNNDVGLIYGKVLVKNVNKDTLQNFGFVFPGVTSYYNMFLNLLKYHHFIFLPTVVMRREIGEKYKFDPRMKIGEDVLFFLQASRDYMFYGINKPLTIISRGHISLIKNRFKDRFDEKKGLDILWNDKHDKTNMSILLYRQSISNLYLYYSKDYIKKSYLLKYFIYLAKSFFYFPFNIYIYKHLIGDMLLQGKFRNRKLLNA